MKPPQPDPELFVCELKDAQSKGPREIEGYAAVFAAERFLGNLRVFRPEAIDNGGDAIVVGAFKKTLAERIPRRLVRLSDSHNWTSAGTLGTVVDAKEDRNGLWFRAELSQAPGVQDTAQKMVENHLKLSFAYHAIREEFGTIDTEGKAFPIRYLEEVRLKEISVTPYPMNELTEITAVKGGASVLPYQDLPLGKGVWDPVAAWARVEEWANGNLSRFKQAQVIHRREKPLGREAFPLLIADVQEGGLVVLPAALEAAKAEASTWENALDREAALKHLQRYSDRAETLQKTQDDDIQERLVSAAASRARALRAKAAMLHSSLPPGLKVPTGPAG